ncbi:hypothetical protein HK107_00480 [Parvularcula sp. ZS-1/3]|uniref:Uncharacterized protein n=1 Tax=Parvularcula mediterranea TaxID=2732508 RepID=A0A7Y3W438_9PROT|nr:hypothetical protein [Parvularcula mediterranea]NNU14796.1 hypothetical protein [Parvularcula mediterranea]
MISKLKRLFREPGYLLAHHLIRRGYHAAALAWLKALSKNGLPIGPGAAELMRSLWARENRAGLHEWISEVEAIDAVLAREYRVRLNAHLKPQDDHLDDAIDVANEMRGPLADLRQLEMATLALDGALRWHSLEKARSVLEQFPALGAINSAASATIAAAYCGAILREEGPDTCLDAIHRFTDDAVEDHSQTFAIRVTETAHAARIAKGEPPSALAPYERFIQHVTSRDQLQLAEAWRDLCDAGFDTQFLVRTDKDQAVLLIDRLKEAARASIPFLALRLGDGEGYGCPPLDGHPAFVSSDKRIDNYLEADLLHREMSWWGLPLDQSQRDTFIHRFQSSILDADIIGVPNIYRLCRDGSPSFPVFDRHSGRGLARVMGFILSLARSGALDEATFTDERFNHLLGRSEMLEVASAAESVVVVSPYTDEKIRMALGPVATKLSTLLIPPHVRVRSAVGSTDSLPQSFDGLAAEVEAVAKPGTLVLLAAGFLAKDLGARAKRRGACALDLGSSLDRLMGVRARSLADVASPQRSKTSP